MESAMSASKPARAQKPDLEVIAPPEGTVDVAGVTCTVRRIRTRELMMLARVLTAGLGDHLDLLSLGSEGEDDDSWQERGTALLLMAIPDAHEEVLELLRVLVVPRQKIVDEEVRNLFAKEMANPDPGVVMEVFAVLVAQEKDTFPALLGKARQVFGMVTALFAKGKTTKKTTG
jgi:hypothetical protein